jgi:predicted esterase
MTPPSQAERLAELLREAGADVTLWWQAGGHTVTREEVGAAREWIGQCLLAASREVE